MSPSSAPGSRPLRRGVRVTATILGGLLAVSGLVVGCASTTGPTATTASPTAAPSAASPGTTDPAATPGASATTVDITEAGLRARLDALATVSTEAAGFRAVGTPGFDAAADLVAGELRTAGWSVTEDAFTMPSFVDDGGSTIVVGGQTFGGGDVAPLIFAPGGQVTGPVVAIEWGASAPTGAGCSTAGYGDLPDGAIVLVPAGGCFRRQQVIAAQDAGAAGFVAGYPTAESGQVLRPTLIEPAGLEIPAVGATRPVGDALAAAAAEGGTATLVANATTATAATRSIIGELAGSEPGAVVMLGGHLDSVIDGPGINDNGSGVAALLEVARALGGSRPRATIRLAFWTGEELGLVGSSRYVRGLTSEDREAIVVYLNADMVASPNGFAGVYDDPGSPPGSSVVSDLLSTAVGRAGGAPVGIAEGGSDHVPFAAAGIAIGGVFSGALDLVLPEQAIAPGTTAGLPADPCYHLRCDDGSDLDLGLARILATALADVTTQLANDPAQLSR